MMFRGGFAMRRPGGGGAASIAEIDGNFGTLTSTARVIFSTTPAEGQLIVIFHARPAGATITLSAPSGFSTAYNSSPDDSPVACYYKVAGASETNIYICGSTVTNSDHITVGYLIDGASSVSAVATLNDTSATSMTIPASTQSVGSGSVVLALRSAGQNPVVESVGAQSVNNSFAIDFKAQGQPDGTCMTASREYSGSASSQDVTNSWTTSKGFRRGIWVECSV